MRPTGAASRPLVSLCRLAARRARWARRGRWPSGRRPWPGRSPPRRGGPVFPARCGVGHAGPHVLGRAPPMLDGRWSWGPPPWERAADLGRLTIRPGPLDEGAARARRASGGAGPRAAACAPGVGTGRTSPRAPARSSAPGRGPRPSPAVAGGGARARARTRRAQLRRRRRAVARSRAGCGDAWHWRAGGCRDVPRRRPRRPAPHGQTRQRWTLWAHPVRQTVGERHAWLTAACGVDRAWGSARGGAGVG